MAEEPKTIIDISAPPVEPRNVPPPAAEEAEDEGFSFLEMLGGVPVVIKDYLLSSKIAATRKQIYDEFSLSKAERDIAMFTELEVFFGDIPLQEFPDSLWSRLPWKDEEEERGKKLAIAILGKIFFPAQAHVGDVMGLLADLGADLKEFPQEQLETREVSYMDGAQEIVDTVNVGPLDEDMKKRLRHIVENRLRSIRDDLETEQMLTKLKKTGGMELTQQQAGAIMVTVKDRTRMTRYVEQVVPKTSSGAVPAKKFSPEEIKSIYVGTPEEQKAVTLRIEEVLRETGKDAEKLRDSLIEAMQPSDLNAPERISILGNVLALAQEGGLSDALESDDRFKEIIRSHLTGKGRTDEIEGFDDDPTVPKFVNIFLQLLLGGYAGLDESDSARMGLRVINLLKRQGKTEYVGLVAFDLDGGKFKWLSPEQI